MNGHTAWGTLRLPRPHSKLRIKQSLCLALCVSFNTGCAVLTEPAHHALESNSDVLMLDSDLVTPEGFLFVLPDHDLRLQHIEQVRARDAQFKRVHTASPSYGFTPSAYWFRVDAEMPRASETTTATGPERIWYFEVGFALLDEVDLHVFDGDREIFTSRSGREVPLAERDVQHQKHIFRVPFPEGRPLRLYLRVTTDENLIVPISFYSVDAFRLNERQEQMASGVYFGMLISILLYNLFLFVSLREETYFRYSVYLASLIAWQLAFLGFIIFLFPAYPIFAKYYASMMAFSFMLGVAYFVIGFLQLKTHHPYLYRAWIAASLAVVVLMVLVLTYGYYPISAFQTGIGGFFIMLVIASGIASARRGFRSARLFLIAWVPPMIGMSLVVLRNFGIVPTNVVTNYAGHFGTALEAVILSLALADRIHRMKNDLQTFNARLEGQVQSRTRELEAALNDLKREDARHRHELRLAADIQEWVLGAGVMETPYAHIRVRRRFPGIVGGDFYDTYTFPDGSTAVLLADISGHGVPAGFLTAMVKICFHSAARRHNPDPRAILLHMNSEMHRWIKTHDYLTAILITIQAGLVRYANAAHPAGLLLRSTTGHIARMESTGTFIGILDSAEPGVQALMNDEIACTSGDRILLTTDGISEAVDIDDVTFQTHNLPHSLRATRSLGYDLDDACDHLLAQLDEHMGDQANPDDCTLVMLEIR